MKKIQAKLHWMEKATPNAFLFNINAEATPAYGTDRFCCPVIQVNINLLCSLKHFLASSLLVLPSSRMLTVFGTNPKMLSQWKLARLCAAQPMCSQHTHRRCSAPCCISAQLTGHWCKTSPGRQSLAFPKEGHIPTPNPKHKVRGNAVVREEALWHLLGNQATYS